MSDVKPDVWRCFHCDEVFADADAAREHFGMVECEDPICSVTAERYREVERQLAAFLSETDAASTTFYRLGAEHAAKERAAEQKGYDRGLADAKAHPETLGLTAADTAAARIAALEEALIDAGAHLVGAASAYEKHAARHHSVGRAVPDPMFKTRSADFQKAAKRVQERCRALLDAKP